jgi:hypothetical protein
VHLQLQHFKATESRVLEALYSPTKFELDEINVSNKFLIACTLPFAYFELE